MFSQIYKNENKTSTVETTAKRFLGDKRGCFIRGLCFTDEMISHILLETEKQFSITAFQEDYLEFLRTYGTIGGECYDLCGIGDDCIEDQISTMIAEQNGFECLYQSDISENEIKLCWLIASINNCEHFYINLLSGKGHVFSINVDGKPRFFAKNFTVFFDHFYACYNNARFINPKYSELSTLDMTDLTQVYLMENNSASAKQRTPLLEEKNVNKRCGEGILPVIGMQFLPSTSQIDDLEHTALEDLFDVESLPVSIVSSQSWISDLSDSETEFGDSVEFLGLVEEVFQAASSSKKIMPLSRRIDLDGVKAISQLENFKIVTGGHGRTVLLSKKPQSEQDNTTSNFIKSPQSDATQNKRTEICAPEFISNPFYFCFHCKKEVARFACGSCRKPFCTKKCQIADWPSHQYLCKVVKGVSESLLESYKSSHSPATDSSYMSESSSDCEKPLDQECPVVKTMKRLNMETQSQQTLNSSSTIKSPTENIFNVRRMPLNTRVTEKPIEHMPLKEENVEKVSIINIESPSKFWIQLDKFSSTLLNLEKELSFIQKINISAVNTNMFCCTQLDNKVCRGKIIKEKSPHEVCVYLVDYGKTLTTSKSNIFQLPQELRKCPMQAVCCKLVDTHAADIEWNSGDLDSFQLHTANKHYKAVVLKCNSEINEVSLINEDGISLFSILALERSTNSDVDDLSPSAESDSGPPTIWTKMKPGSSFTLLALPSATDNDIWCYLFFDKESNVQDIVEVEKLLHNYSSEDITLCAEEGDFAAGFSTEYQQYYRCVVLKRKRESFLVRYIDYGNEEEITCLNALSQELLQRFSYLVKCEKPASLSADDFATSFEVVVIKVEKNVAELSINLDKKLCMYCYPCYPTSFSEVHEKLAVKCSTPSVKEISHSSKPVDPKIHAEKVMKPKILSLDTKYNVKVVFIKTVAEVFVQLNEEEKEMNAMFIEFNKYCNSVNSSYIPNVEEIVSCKFSDGAWYRGQVKEKLNDKFRVFFVDYGNEDIVSPKDIQHLSEKFICPKYSVCVSFSGIKNEDVSPRFLDQLLAENWDLKVLDCKKSPVEVMLFLKDTPLTDFIEHEKSFKRNKSALRLKKLPTGVPVDIKITHEENGILYLHQAEDIKSLEEMCTKINSLRSVHIPKKVYLNNVYCGLFTDTLWYRVVVLEETSPNAYYKVQFLDFGNIQNLSINDLRELSDDVFMFPIYCIPVVVQNRNTYADLNLEDQYTVEVVDNKGKIQEVKFLSIPEAVKLPNISSIKKQQLNDALTEVLICHAEDGVHYCQLSTDNDEVLDLFKKLQKLSKESDSPKILNEGDLVSAQSSDGFWYRASIVSVKKAPLYSVFFVDYGNTESVTFDCIKILPEELLKYPIFAIPMKIQNIADVKDSDAFTTNVPIKKIKTLDDNVHIVDIVLKKVVDLPNFSTLQKQTLPSNSCKITLCHVEGSIFYVQLASNENMLEKLRCSLLESSKFDSLPGLPEIGDIICAKFTDNVWYRSSVQEVLSDGKFLKVSFFDYGNSETVTFENTKILSSELATYPIFSIPVKFNDLDSLKKVLGQDLDTFDVKVVGMDEDIQIVDVVLGNDVENVHKVVYNPVFLTSFENSSLPLNETCKIIFKNTKDNLYFAVKFNDCEAMEKLSSVLQNAGTEIVSHIPSINEVLLVKRSDNLLHRGCITKSSESNESVYSVYFIDLGMTEVVTKTSMYCFPENCKSFPIFVFKALVETDESIVLEKNYYAQCLKQTSDGTFTIKVFHQHMISTIDKQELPLNEVRSVMFFHKENDLLYLQDMSNVQVLAEMQTALTECSSQLSIPYKPSVGELLCAKSNLDGSWYRGCVEDISSNQFKIQFIDYGNCEHVNERHLQCIPSMLTKFPSLCIPVKFIDNKISNDIELEKLYTVVSESKSSNNIQNIRLVVAEDANNEKGVAGENKISSIANDVKKFKYTQCTFVPFSSAEEQDIVIYSVDEDFTVFCAPYNQDNISANIQLPSELTEYCTSKGKPFENGCEPELDDMVLAKFSEDGQWYRAAIIDKTHPLYDVNFVDYGNSEQLNISQLRRMEEQFMTLDIQATLCSLTGFTAAYENLPEVYAELKSFTIFSCQEPLKAKIKKKGEDIFIDIPRITAHLVDKKLAVISNQN